MPRHTAKVALVPSAFFDAASAREILSRTVRLDSDEIVRYASLPEYSARLVYSLSGANASDAPSEESLPELFFLLKGLAGIKEHNRIAASYAEGLLSLAIAQGEKLLLANVFEAADFTTAEYFLFMAIRKLQMNPEVSAVYFRTPLSGEEEMSLYRYFKSVERL